VLLHGFPEFWYAWRHQIPALADAGYRVVAPDLRGYNTSDKPPRVRDYRPRVLAQDVADLVVALGAGSAAVAGHDWGGGLAWLLAMQHPERIERLVVLNAPHPIRLLKACATPGSCGAAGTCWPSRPLGCPSGWWRPGTSGPCAGPYASNRPGRAPSRLRTSTAALNYYRAAFRANPLAQVRSLRRVDIPTLIIWGEQDRYLGRELAEPDRAWVPDVRVERIAEASHWVQADAPERVNQLMVDFLLEHMGS
jgi:epoxide hydrolase 4